MRNEKNNCYVNVVIQSLLPCSALMQLLSHCAGNDPDRPFYSCMVRLCKEFHGRVKDGEALNVLHLPQVKNIISSWQAIGAQQDAGEFLFHILNGMHEECKWKACLATPLEATADENSFKDSTSHSVEVRASGGQEDSPIRRLFGGLVRSSVRTDHAKADSISLEPFNHITLDISSSYVTSVWTALEAYCGAEKVNDGKAIKWLQFAMLPKVLILSLKRFSYNKDLGCTQKIKKAIKFEEKLVVDRSWLCDDVAPQEYQLTGVICHHGDWVNGGHYNAYVRYNTDWCLYDDVVFRQVDACEVLKQNFTTYLLLYQCQGKVDIRP
jgi:ubiquitin C-terminal hydrolase